METGKNQYSTVPMVDFYLGHAEFPTAQELLQNKTAEFITVEPKFQHRPDLLSYDLYQNSNYWWIIVLLNRDTLKDPIRDLKSGMTLRVLSLQAVKGIV